MLQTLPVANPPCTEAPSSATPGDATEGDTQAFARELRRAGPSQSHSRTHTHDAPAEPGAPNAERAAARHADVKLAPPANRERTGGPRKAASAVDEANPPVSEPGAKEPVTHSAPEAVIEPAAASGAAPQEPAALALDGSAAAAASSPQPEIAQIAHFTAPPPDTDGHPPNGAPPPQPPEIGSRRIADADALRPAVAPRLAAAPTSALTPAQQSAARSTSVEQARSAATTEARFDTTLQVGATNQAANPATPAPAATQPGMPWMPVPAFDIVPSSHADPAPPPAARASLDPPVGSREFSAALGSQVTLWVRDGVQEARLQLHPAELGPVSIQIVLDGTAAYVDFHAMQAQTRGAIEQSLPALALALREAGFTLSGGGVFGQSDGDRGAQASDSGSHDSSRAAPRRAEPDLHAAATIAGNPAALRPWRRGLLDVFA